MLAMPLAAPTRVESLVARAALLVPGRAGFSTRRSRTRATGTWPTR
jgi:hypothetical protein